MNVLDVNTVNLRQMYPTALGQTVSQSGTSANQMPSAAGVSISGATPNAATTPADHAAMIGGQGSAITGGLVFLGLLIGLMFIAKKLGSESDFSNIKLSAFNVLVIGLAALIGLPIWKYFLTRFPIPALSTWALAA